MHKKTVYRVLLTGGMVLGYNKYTTAITDMQENV
jgi:hypothetical protein